MADVILGHNQMFPTLAKMIELGGSYGPSWGLDDEELERLSALAEEAFSTMNGDIGTIEITVKQFAQLVYARSLNQRK